MKKTLQEYLKPCLVRLLKSLTYKDGWLYGHYRIAIEVNDLDVSDLDKQCIGPEDIVTLFVLNCTPFAYDLIWSCSEDCEKRPSDWTAQSLITLVLKNTEVTVDAISRAFVQGKACFYKRAGKGYVVSERESAEWVSYPAESLAKHLPMGYPLVFVELWLKDLALMLASVGTVYTSDKCKPLLLL